MQPRKISIIYDNSPYVAKAAKLFAAAVEPGQVHLVNIISCEPESRALAEADTIIFGCHSSFASVSAEFKQFMESTEESWYRQPWRNKFAAGFTVSTCNAADNLIALQTLSLFAAYHSMNWISLGVLPRFVCGQQSDGQNRLSAFTGLAMQTVSSDVDAEFHTGDLLTLELFAKRILQININHNKTNS
jgi:NAD(P)H dehydrogenase (quinone)